MTNAPHSHRLIFEAFCPIDIDKLVIWHRQAGTLRAIGYNQAFLDEFADNVLESLGFNRLWLFQQAPEPNCKILSIDGTGSGPPFDAKGKLEQQSLRNAWFRFSVAPEYLDRLPGGLNRMITEPGRSQEMIVSVLSFPIRIHSLNATVPAVAYDDSGIRGFGERDEPEPETPGKIMSQGLLNGSAVRKFGLS